MSFSPASCKAEFIASSLSYSSLVILPAVSSLTSHPAFSPNFLIWSEYHLVQATASASNFGSFSSLQLSPSAKHARQDTDALLRPTKHVVTSVKKGSPEGRYTTWLFFAHVSAAAKNSGVTFGTSEALHAPLDGGAGGGFGDGGAGVGGAGVGAGVVGGGDGDDPPPQPCSVSDSIKSPAAAGMAYITKKNSIKRRTCLAGNPGCT